MQVITIGNKNVEQITKQIIMSATDPGESLTKFIRNIEARVFAYMQSAPPQELNDN